MVMVDCLLLVTMLFVGIGLRKVSFSDLEVVEPTTAGYILVGVNSDLVIATAQCCMA